MQGIRAIVAAVLVCLGVSVVPAAHAAVPPRAELLFPQYSTLGTAIALDPAGRLVVGGDYSAGVGYAITRLTPKGKVDRSFGSKGITRVKIGKSDFGDLSSVAVLPDGRILVNGTVGADGSQQNGFGTLFGVARLTPKGRLDRSFAQSGSIRFTLDQGMDDGMWVTPLPDGRVLTGGDTGDGATIFGCAASWDADFNQTPGFAPLCLVPKGASVAYFGAAAPDAGGSAVVSVGGMAAGGAGRTPVFGIGRVTSSGAADSSFGDGGFTTTDFGAPAHDGAQQGRRPLASRPGGWIVGGTTAKDFGLVGFTAAGALDPSFGRGGKLELNVDGKKTRDVLVDLVPLHGGRYLAVGQTEIGGNRAAGSKLLLAAVASDGKPVPSFGKHGHEALDARALGVPEIDQIDGAVALPDGSVAIVGASHVDNFHGRPAYSMLVVHVKPDGRLAPFG